MNRRQLLAGLAASGLMNAQTGGEKARSFLELKVWKLHNSQEDQGARVADFLQAGAGPALARAGAKLAGAFSNVIAQGGPFYVTLAEYSSLSEFQAVLEKLSADSAYQHELEKLGSGPGLPFVRVESSVLRSFAGFPQVAIPDAGEKRPPRIFEWRTYESQSFTTLQRKIGMFHSGEMGIFERLGMKPVFFGETLIGPNQPNLMYMLSYDDLAARDRLWGEFGSDPEWKKLRSEPQLRDSEIVANISNVILRPLTFSAIQ